MNKIILLFLFTSFGLQAKMLRYDVYGSQKYPNSFKEVCQVMEKRIPLLVEVIDSRTISCMGEDVNVSKFCQKKYKGNPEFARPIIDKKNRQVLCQTAKRIVLGYKCSPNSQSLFCRESKAGCRNMKKVFAQNLDMVHHSLIKRDDESRDLNCYFENNISLNSFE